MAAGILVGLLAAIALPVAVASRRRPLEQAEEAHEILGAPMLGEVVSGRGKSQVSYDIIASALAAAVPRGSIALTDSRSSQRSAGVMTNVAFAVAAQGGRVGLLDAAGGRHGVARSLNIYEGPVTMTTEFEVGEGILEVATANPRKPSEVVAALAELRQRCDRVIVACPSLEEAGAAQILRASDAAVVIVPAGELSARVTRLRSLLSLLDVAVLGFVFTHGRISANAAVAQLPRTTAQRN